MMVAAVVHEIPAGIGNILQHFSPLRVGFEIDMIGNLEPQQVPVEIQRILLSQETYLEKECNKLYLKLWREL